ncbi:MAG: sensor domain-containing diguanylate cyclase [Woeseiaceae bacterium]
MIEPPVPVDELLRLETLRNLKILDTDPEERFDRVTRLAQRIFGTPIALVSLVDSDRQWFKSSQGLEATETPRDISFCGHAILEDETMVVEDALTDKRFEDNPLVSEHPNIRFYAGYPISAPDGNKIGTLCIIDSEPRTLSDEDLQTLQELGQIVEEEIAVSSMMHSDPVTGLSNDTGFAIVSKHLLAMCKRMNSSATLMLVHLSNLHLIRGFMGQEACDRAAIEVTQLLLASYRDSDIVGRIAEDAFAVLLSNSGETNITAAKKRFLDRLNERNETSSMAFELDVNTYEITYHPDEHENIESLLDAARSLAEGDNHLAESDEHAQSA